MNRMQSFSRGSFIQLRKTPWIHLPTAHTLTCECAWCVQTYFLLIIKAQNPSLLPLIGKIIAWMCVFSPFKDVSELSACTVQTPFPLMQHVPLNSSRWSSGLSESFVCAPQISQQTLSLSLSMWIFWNFKSSGERISTQKKKSWCSHSKRLTKHWNELLKRTFKSYDDDTFEEFYQIYSTTAWKVSHCF